MITIETTNWEFAHGAKPKGFGGWVFDVTDTRCNTRPVFIPGAMTFANAKKWMRANMPADAVRVSVAT